MIFGEIFTNLEMLAASSNVRANLPKLHLLSNGGGLHPFGLLVQSHSGARE